MAERDERWWPGEQQDAQEFLQALLEALQVAPRAVPAEAPPDSFVAKNCFTQLQYPVIVGLKHRLKEDRDNFADRNGHCYR